MLTRSRRKSSKDLSDKDLQHMDRSKVIKENLSDFEDYAVPGYEASPIGNDFLFLYISDDLGLFNKARVHKYYIRTMNSIGKINHGRNLEHWRRIGQILKFSQNRKYVKALKTVQMFLRSNNSNFEKFLYYCRNAQNLKFDLTKAAGVTLNDELLKRLKYTLTSRTKTIHINDEWSGYDQYPQVIKFFRLIHYHPVQELDWDSIAHYFYYKGQLSGLEEVEPLSCRVAKMWWFKYINFGPVFKYPSEEFSFEDILNRLKNLKEIKLKIDFPTSPALKDIVWECCNRFFDNFVNVEHLTGLALELHPTSVSFFKRICSNSFKLLKLHLIMGEIGTQVINVWDNLSNLILLEDLEITPAEKGDGQEICFPYYAFSNLLDLRRFKVRTKFSPDKEFLNFEELGEVMGCWKKLKTLEIRTYFSSTGFSKFLMSSCKNLAHLEEVKFILQYDSEIQIGEEFIEWMRPKQHIKYCKLILGTYGGIITPDTMRICCEAISTLSNLSLLKFGLGSISYKEEGMASLAYFKSVQEKSMISRLIKTLPSLRKLVLSLGSGYLENKELSSIMDAVRSLPKLHFFAFGSNFSKITPIQIDELVENIKVMKAEKKITKLIIKPSQYSEKLTNLEEVLEDYLGFDYGSYYSQLLGLYSRFEGVNCIKI